jgi:hypothetical protein
MFDLQPLIARLVEDLLRLIRGASVEDLREILGSAEADPPARRPRRRRSKLMPSPKRRAARPKRKRTARPARAVEPSARAPEPPPPAEITDPERLLAATATAAPTIASVRPHAAPDVAKEPSAPSGPPPPAGANVPLRAGESVAHASEHGGVVIRRRKRV